MIIDDERLVKLFKSGFVKFTLDGPVLKANAPRWAVETFEEFEEMQEEKELRSV